MKDAGLGIQTGTCLETFIKQYVMNLWCENGPVTARSFLPAAEGCSFRASRHLKVQLLILNLQIRPEQPTNTNLQRKLYIHTTQVPACSWTSPPTAAPLLSLNAVQRGAGAAVSQPSLLRLLHLRVCACMDPDCDSVTDEDDKYLQVSLGDGLLLHSELQVLHLPAEMCQIRPRTTSADSSHLNSRDASGAHLFSSSS